jgi:hypothetical protein
MGYYTRFTLSTDGAVDDEVIAEKLTEISQYTWRADLQLDEAKWYDYHKDMTKLSNLYPTSTFTLEGVGEEQGDHWIAYYKNGKSQTTEAIITFEPFDETKLKD